jgi:hypothetical protein
VEQVHEKSIQTEKGGGVAAGGNVGRRFADDARGWRKRSAKRVADVPRCAFLHGRT